VRPAWLKAAGLDTKYISALLGHGRTSFTDKTYTLFPEIMRSAAEAAAAVVPRRPASASKSHRRAR
jgi:hypothetical protein